MDQKKTLTGRFQGSGKGFGFFIPEGGSARTDDYFVPPKAAAGAWDGDRVEAVTTGEDPHRPGRPCVKITQIIERENKLVTGVILPGDTCPGGGKGRRGRHQLRLLPAAPSWDPEKDLRSRRQPGGFHRGHPLSAGH